MDSGNVCCNVVEGKVNRVNVVYVDDNGNPKKGGGQTPAEVVERELPFQVSIHSPDCHPTMLACGLSQPMGSPCDACCNAQLNCICQLPVMLVAMRPIELQSKSPSPPFWSFSLQICYASILQAMVKECQSFQWLSLQCHSSFSKYACCCCAAAV